MDEKVDKFVALVSLLTFIEAQRTPQMEKLVVNKFNSLCEGGQPFVYCECNVDATKQPPFASGREIRECIPEYCVCPNGYVPVVETYIM